MTNYSPDNFREIPDYLNEKVPPDVTQVVVMAPADNFSVGALKALQKDAKEQNVTQAQPAKTRIKVRRSINTFHARAGIGEAVPGVTLNSGFFSAGERSQKGLWGHLEVPFGRIYEHFLAMRPDLLITQVTPVFWGTDHNGVTGWWYGLACGNDYTQVLAESGVPVWAVVNSKLPSTPSGTNWISADTVVGETISTEPLHYVQSR